MLNLFSWGSRINFAKVAKEKAPVEVISIDAFYISPSVQHSEKVYLQT